MIEFSHTQILGFRSNLFSSLFQGRRHSLPDGNCRGDSWVVVVTLSSSTTRAREGTSDGRDGTPIGSRPRNTSNRRVVSEGRREWKSADGSLSRLPPRVTRVPASNTVPLRSTDTAGHGHSRSSCTRTTTRHPSSPLPYGSVILPRNPRHPERHPPSLLRKTRSRTHLSSSVTPVSTQQLEQAGPQSLRSIQSV